MDARAPGVPADYYRRIQDVEQGHWWYRGMREISAALLGGRLSAGGRVLDAGCGTGGYLRWLLDRGSFSGAAAVDVAGEAIALARNLVPEAELRVAPLSELPFDSESFDLVVSNDVLQHVPEEDVELSLGELHRVLRPGGTLLLPHERVAEAAARAGRLARLRQTDPEPGARAGRLRDRADQRCKLLALALGRAPGTAPARPD